MSALLSLQANHCSSPACSKAGRALLSRTHHSKIVFRCAANFTSCYYSDGKASCDEDKKGLQEVQPYLALLNIALRYPADRHVCVYRPVEGARGALLWTLDEKVLCLRGSACGKSRFTRRRRNRGSR
jgi:hypothetical protein